MRLFKVLFKRITVASSDENFLVVIDRIINLVAKLLAIAMVLVTIAAVFDLCRFLISDLIAYPFGSFTVNLLGIFGLFLNVLIAIEILENITAYLRNHVVQLELVIVTSLTAVARKIIIFDSKEANADLAGLALAILSLAISYWIVRRLNAKSHH